MLITAKLMSTISGAVSGSCKKIIPRTQTPANREGK
jgi:hypothetical protein